MSLKVEKRLLYIGSGAGLGVVIPVVLRKYDGVLIPQLAQWGRYSTFIPISTGILSIILSRYKKIRNKNIKEVLFYYGITATLSGIIYATFPTTGLTQAYPNAYFQSQQSFQEYERTDGMPKRSRSMEMKQVPATLAYSRPGWPYFSRARGFGVDTTSYPTFNENKIIDS